VKKDITLIPAGIATSRETEVDWIGRSGMLATIDLQLIDYRGISLEYSTVTRLGYFPFVIVQLILWAHPAEMVMWLSFVNDVI
jgi:hypothetical protein